MQIKIPHKNVTLNHSAGFTFLEVLVALMVISTAFLAVIGMQLTALHVSQADYGRSLAAVQLSSMLDRLRANHSKIARERELQIWNAWNSRLLPEGVGTYLCSIASAAGNNGGIIEMCTVTLKWQKQSLSLVADL